MTDVPKAHRRLVPRVPRKDPDEDLELTAERVVIRVDDVSSDESLEMTAVRPAFEIPTAENPALDSNPYESLDLTAKRPAAPPADYDIVDDEVPTEDPDADAVTADPSKALPTEDPDADDDDQDAGETIALPARAETERPKAPPISRSFVLAAHPDSTPPPPAMNLAKSSQASVRFASSSRSSLEQPVPEQEDLDANAFSDLEPTALKAPMTSDAEDRPTTHISPAERGLLAAMSEGHEASRLVYVTWLERRGEKQRAEFLRLEHALAAMSPLDIRHQESQDRLRELAQKISVDWRSRVARSLIENCNANAGCPKFWRALPAEADDVRNCAACGEQVFYCVTIDLARGRVQAGQRVALDVTVERAPDDLEPRCAGCTSLLPRGTRFCPHCGRSTIYY